MEINEIKNLLKNWRNMEKKKYKELDTRFRNMRTNDPFYNKVVSDMMYHVGKIEAYTDAIDELNSLKGENVSAPKLSARRMM